jgi:hypothetical protein
VIVSWWERNQTANEPVARISTDNGQTLGDVLKLATNGTIGEKADEEEWILEKFVIEISYS